MLGDITLCWNLRSENDGKEALFGKEPAASLRLMLVNGFGIALLNLEGRKPL